MAMAYTVVDEIDSFRDSLARQAAQYQHNHSAPWWRKVPEMSAETAELLKGYKLYHSEYVPDFVYLAERMYTISCAGSSKVTAQQIARVLSLIAVCVNSTAYTSDHISSFFAIPMTAAPTLDSLIRARVMSESVYMYDDIPDDLKAYAVLCASDVDSNTRLPQLLGKLCNSYYLTSYLSGTNYLGSATARRKVHKYLRRYLLDYDEYLHDCFVYPETGHVVCYKSHADVIKGKVSVESIGSYLRRVLPEHVEDHVVNDMVNSVKIGSVKFVTSVDEITAAYTHESSNGSCMNGGFDRYNHHPSAVYAELPDVAVAVLLLENGEQAARAVVNTERKEFCNVYGDYTLHAKLIELGYTKNDYYLDGVKLRKLYTDDSEQYYLMPYLDGDAIMFTPMEDDDYHIVSDDGYYRADTTSCDYDANATYVDCECCCARVPEDEMASTYNGEYVCEHCIDSSYTRVYVADGVMDYVPYHDVTDCAYSCEPIYCNYVTQASNGDYVAEWYLDEYEERLAEEEEEENDPF